MSPGDDYIGSIAMFAGDFAPRSYRDCDGAELQVHDNQVIYSVIGNNYGGRPGWTFNLPDLRPKGPNGQPMPFERGKPRYCICVNGEYPTRD